MSADQDRYARPFTGEDAGWRFDGDYDNAEQVAEFLPAFEAVLADVEAVGYRYNDSFKSRIPAIVGPHEDAAIYLLQGAEREARKAEEVERLIADGYEWIDAPKRGEKAVRLSHVVLIPKGRANGDRDEMRDCRLVVVGYTAAVLLKGKRTHGKAVRGRRILGKRA